MATVRAKSPIGLGKRRSLLAVALALAACGAARGALPTMDSASFQWKYEMNVLPSSLDLDGNGVLDFYRSSSSITTDGNVVTLPSNQYFESLGSGIWQNNFDFASGYTIEARVKVLSQTSGTGAFALYSSASSGGLGGIVKVGADNQGWGRTASDLGTNDNTDDFHVFRVVHTPNVSSYAVWRDDVLLGGGLPYIGTQANSFWFGDGLDHWQGSSQVDYVRFTPGAYAPPGCIYDPPPPPSFPGTIVSVQKELWIDAPLGTTAYAWQYNVGPGLQRREVRGIEEENDTWRQLECRISTDNGRTWSAPQSLPDNDVYYQGIRFAEGEYNGAMVYDPTSGRLVESWLRQVYVNEVYHNFTYYRMSTDMGQTWTDPEQLKYEPGADFNPSNPLDPNYLNHNEAYFGNNVLLRSDGKLMHAVAAAKDPNDPNNPLRMGSICFTGTWDSQTQDYTWTPSEPMVISPEWSSRGLMEPEVAELEDARIAIVWRTSNTGTMPGRKFYSISTDGGQTFTNPAVWKYDDGSDFYSPSSWHRMIRNSLTGKLYWIGNITFTQPYGNLPRYPLVIAEVDEDNFSLKKDTVTVIDTRAPEETEIMLSNFSVLENRETHAFEIYMCRYLDPGGNDTYKYTLTLAELANLIPGDLNRDGVVGAADLDIVRAHWGQNVQAGYWSLGDANGDGVVGSADLDILRAHWGNGTPPGPVPEPSSLALLIAGLGMLVVGRTRRCRQSLGWRHCHDTDTP